MSVRPPQSEIEDMKQELEILEELSEAILFHFKRYEERRALNILGEYERRQRDLEIQISFWEEKNE